MLIIVLNQDVRKAKLLLSRNSDEIMLMNLSLILEKKKRLKLLRMPVNHHLQVLIDMYLNFKVATVEQLEVIEIMFVSINER
jgi:hypothetical protein